ncbi:MAG: serine hydrolase [Alphaproteobacteria bacterium]
MRVTGAARICPPDLADGWPVAAPGDMGIDPALLAGLAPQFEAWTDANLHAALIAWRGTLIYERYFTGEDWAFARPLGVVAHDATMLHDLRSITKSVTGLVAGVARDRGWLGDLDRPVLDWLPEHADLRDGGKGAITVRHLLTMTAGFDWNEDLPYADPRNSERQMMAAPDPVRFVLEQPLRRPPGAVHVYNGGHTTLLAAVLERASGMPFDALVQETLLAPLGIARAEWVRYDTGMAMAPSGLRLRPRDLLKVGQVAVGGGRWRDRAIVGADWIAEATAAHANAQGLWFYGYHWWLGRSLVGRRELRWAAGIGWGGQRLFVVPELDLVVLALAGLYGNPALQPLPGEVVLRRYALPAALAASRRPR